MGRVAIVKHPRLTMGYWVGWALLTLLGWKVEGETPKVKKCVFIAAPHTTNWDMPIMLAVAYMMGVRIQFMMKHTMFRWPFHGFFTWLGGVPIDRRSRRNTVDQCIQAFDEADEMILSIPPEGTRSKVEYWKTGFYHIAHGANVPLVLGFLDYKRKVGGLGPLFYTTGDIHADVAEIAKFYEGVMGKFPEKMMDRIQIPAEERARPRSAVG